MDFLPCRTAENWTGQDEKILPLIIPANQSQTCVLFLKWDKWSRNSTFSSDLIYCQCEKHRVAARLLATRVSEPKTPRKMEEIWSLWRDELLCRRSSLSDLHVAAAKLASSFASLHYSEQRLSSLDKGTVFKPLSHWVSYKNKFLVLSRYFMETG